MSVEHPRPRALMWVRCHLLTCEEPGLVCLTYDDPTGFFLISFIILSSCPPHKTPHPPYVQLNMSVLHRAKNVPGFLKGLERFLVLFKADAVRFSGVTGVV